MMTLGKGKKWIDLADWQPGKWSYEWQPAVSGLLACGQIIEDPLGPSWKLGTGFDAIDTSGWPIGRAQFVSHRVPESRPELINFSG